MRNSLDMSGHELKSKGMVFPSKLLRLRLDPSSRPQNAMFTDKVWTWSIVLNGGQRQSVYGPRIAAYNTLTIPLAQF